MHFCYIFVVFALAIPTLAEDLRLLDLPPEEAQQHIESKDQTLKYAPKIESNVPAVRVLGDTPTNVLEDIYLANQYHGQDGLGGYLYGYSVPDIAKTEKKRPDGDLKGAYQYINGGGQEIKVQYWDDGTGFHQVDNLPEVLPKQVEDAPDVQAAKEEFFRRWHEEAERNSKPVSPPQETADASQFNQQYQPSQIQGQYSSGVQSEQHPLGLNQGGFSTGSGAGQQSSGQYQPGATHTQQSQYYPGQSQGQYQPGQNHYLSSQSQAGQGQYQLPGHPSSQNQGQTGYGQYQTAESQRRPSYSENQSGQGPVQSYEQHSTDPGQYLPGQNQHGQTQSGQYQPNNQQSSQIPYDSQGNQAQPGQIGYQYRQIQSSGAVSQPGQAGHQSGQSQLGQGQYQSSQSGAQGYGQGPHNSDYSGQSSNQQLHTQNQPNNEWEYKATEEEKGPPRGFFYNFDYPVGIIVQKQGADGGVHKRESLEHLYSQNKDNYDQQLKNGASPDGSSQSTYQVHL